MRKFATRRAAGAAGHYLPFVLVALLLPAEMPALAQPAATSPAVRDVGDRLQLFVDDALIERMAGASLRLHSPEPREVVFRFDQPWEGAQSGYVTMMADEDGYRMYYRGGGDLSREYTCLALSDDGIHWTRPSLGLFEYNESRDNNIVWTGELKAYWESHNFSPFEDTRPGVPAAERYKAVTLARGEVDGETRRVLVAFLSPDGIHWQRMQAEPIITDGGFDSHNVAFWDTVQKQYVCYFRIGRNGKRSVARSTSPDFRTWSATQPLDFGDSPLEHLYTNGIFPYPGAPDVYIGLPHRFVPERKTIGVDRRPIDGTSDGVFMSSRDGVHWDRRFMEAFIRPGLDPANWGGAHGNNCPAWGILRTGPAEVSIYWSQHYANYPERGDHAPQLRRGTLRPDGFVSIHAPYAGGEVVTRPLRFDGGQLVLNVSTSAVGSVRVEILDAENANAEDSVGKATAGGAAGRAEPTSEPVAGFELERCHEIYGDELERVVTWEGNPELKALAGRPVRLRFVLRDADVYAFRVRNIEQRESDE